MPPQITETNPSPMYATPRIGQGEPQAQNPQDRRHRTQNKKSSIPIVYKIVVALCFVLGYTIYRILYVKFDNSRCIYDTYFEATWSANRWMRYNAPNAILGAMQVIMDAWILFAGISWLILTKNMRFPLSAGLIFLFRSLFLNIQKLPFDDYIVWHSPGFLSFTVPYDRTRDFFFSGHTASLTIVVIEMFYLGWNWVGAFGFLNLVFMLNFLIISRVHYIIDIIGGLIFAVTSYRMTILILKYEDYLFSIAFYIGRNLFYRIKKNNKQKQYAQIESKQTEHAFKMNPNVAM